MGSFLPTYSSATESDALQRIVGYLRDWNYRPFSELALGQLAHINIAFCNPDEDGRLHCDIPEQKLKGIISTAHENDVNVSDLVLLQRWLLAAPDAELADWQAGDLCKDGRLVVFDLCMMRKALVEKT